MPESQQKQINRVRRPRVQIEYDVETNGSMKKIELPFVVGVMADLSGQPKEPLKPLKDRKFTVIDRDNFDSVLARSAPRAAFRVANKLTDDGSQSQLAVELNFKKMDDFEPARVAEQVEPMRELMELRKRLTELLSRMEGNDKLEKLLADVVANSDTAKAMAEKITGGKAASEEG
jgi:type VI secretion system protein ImpB